METRNESPATFLEAVIAEKVQLSGSEFGEANFHRLLAITRDRDRTNRVLATLLLSKQEVDTPAIRNILLDAAFDEDKGVRAEAILGLAQRDQATALPLVKAGLSETTVMLPIFEAAALLADSSLVVDLRAFVTPSGDVYLDQAVNAALAACESTGPRK